ncbi:hypothetical protein PUMCH_003026 [Australozyma saopauloensis]|uniref:DNA-binding protein REB1 n=1 Tax=Australozyma saopauloensis TaxID=291208 RepID=A0AAX4HBJ5_9ASCO|nr:hypothetical protein PUMCH_003026 [[Candida] saopauloensis]
MQNQQEIGGAKALLLLGTKDTLDNKTHGPQHGPAQSDLNDDSNTSQSQNEEHNLNENELHVVHDVDDERHHLDAHGLSVADSNDDLLHEHLESESHDHNHEHNHQHNHEQHHNHHENGHIGHVHHDSVEDHDQELFDKASQQLNDAVEAAVMRYVGGTLATEDDLLGHGEDDPQNAGPDGLPKRQRVQDDLMNEYHWDRFLEPEEVAAFDRPTPRKRARKSFMSGGEIDPELADLDASAEHDLLVHAAIGDLAKELQLPDGQGKLHHSMFLDARDGSALDASARMSSANGIEGTLRSHMGLNSGNGPASISHLAPKNRHILSQKTRRPLKAIPDGLPLELDLSNGFNSQLKYTTQSIEELVKEAASEAHLWLSTQSNVGARGPRLFSQEEINIVDNFIQAYCRLNNLTRAQICERVWSVDKPKDKFWEYLTKVLPYRSRASVYKHVRRQYHVFNVRAKWTKEEDDQLRKYAEQTTTNWKRIGEAMNRMPEDCRDRWRNYLKCGENRAKNKWSEDEENTLKQIIMELHSTLVGKDKQNSINWTLVSEKMNGIRSRIQCRYKWNKLVRRDLMSRIAMMGSCTKIWLLNRLLDLNVHEQDAINWEYLAQSYHAEHKNDKTKYAWSSSDFLVAFEKLRNSVRDHKILPLHSIISKLLGIVYLTPGPEEDLSVEPDLRPKQVSPDQHRLKKTVEPIRPKEVSAAEREAASVANAAVAAVSMGVNGPDAQHQEYSLWR